MWIISKNYGIFYTKAIPCIKEFPDGTYALIGDTRLLITSQKINDKITEAIKRGYPFLEVE